MNMTAQNQNDTRANPVFWLMWLLPLSAVVGGLATLVIALRDGDRALPAAYHWEGAGLDGDFARQRAAAENDVEVRFEMLGRRCVARVLRAPTDAAALQLQITSASDERRDRSVRLERVSFGVYDAACEALPPGRWLVAIGDDARSWSIRERIAGPLESLTLRARSPDGPVT